MNALALSGVRYPEYVTTLGAGGQIHVAQAAAGVAITGYTQTQGT